MKLKRMTSVAAIVASLAVGVLIVGPAVGAPVKHKTFTVGAMVNSANHPYITATLRSIKAQCKRERLNCVVADAQFDAAKQAAQVEDLINRRVDGILFFPVDVNSARPLLLKAQKARIPVISYGNRVLNRDLPLVRAAVGENSFFEGQQAARIAARQLKGAAAQIATIGGVAGGWVATQRQRGFEAEIKKLNPKVRIVARQPADFNRAKALRIMEDYLVRYPDLDAVYAHDDDMAMGALEAIKADGKVGEIKVYGIGGMGEFLDALEKGEVHGTVWQSPVDFGTLPVKTIGAILHNKRVAKLTYIPMPQITRQNASKFPHLW